MGQIAETKINLLGWECVIRVNGKTAVKDPFTDSGKSVWKYKAEISLNGGEDFIPFDFHGSVYDYEHEDKAKLKGDELIFMAYCVFSDALCYIQHPSFEMFADAFGYNINDKKEKGRAYNAFSGCREIYEKLELTENKLIEIVNYMCDEYEC